MFNFWHRAFVVSKTAEVDTVSEYGCFYDHISGQGLVDNEEEDPMGLTTVTK